MSGAKDVMAVEALGTKAAHYGFRANAEKNMICLWAGEGKGKDVYVADSPIVRFQTVEEAMAWLDGHGAGALWQQVWQRQEEKKRSEAWEPMLVLENKHEEAELQFSFYTGGTFEARSPGEVYFVLSVEETQHFLEWIDTRQK